jgi:hypothetical protein
MKESKCITFEMFRPISPWAQSAIHPQLSTHNGIASSQLMMWATVGHRKGNKDSRYSY